MAGHIDRHRDPPAQCVVVVSTLTLLLSNLLQLMPLFRSMIANLEGSKQVYVRLQMERGLAASKPMNTEIRLLLLFVTRRMCTAQRRFARQVPGRRGPHFAKTFQNVCL